MTRFVLDNTVTMAWCFRDEANDLSSAVLSRLSDLTDTAVVPVLWLYEVANVIALAARRGRISGRLSTEFLQSLGDLPIEIEHASAVQIFDAVRVVSSQFQFTAYDAAYLELAIRQNLAIATFDQALARAARAAKVGVVER